jgi:assimilatory nitrate reductase catalytic subunit
MSRTGTVPRLFGHVPEPVLWMHAEDMAARGIKDGDSVLIRSARGEVIVRAESSAEQRRGDVFLPMHWGSRFMSGAGANALTVSAFDPYSKQPELKHAAVEVVRVELPRELVVLRRLDEGADLERLQSQLSRFPLAALSLFGREIACAMRRARSDRPFELADLDRAIDESGLRSVSYGGARAIASASGSCERPHRRRAARGRNRHLDWLKNGSEQRRRPLSSPSPASGRDRRTARQIVSTASKSRNRYPRSHRAGADLPAIQRSLKCGTTAAPAFRNCAASAQAATPSRRPHKANP